MKKKKITAIQIAPCGKPNPNLPLKKEEFDINPEYTIDYFFKPHIGGIMYSFSKKENQNEKK